MTVHGRVPTCSGGSMLAQARPTFISTKCKPSRSSKWSSETTPPAMASGSAVARHKNASTEIANDVGTTDTVDVPAQSFAIDVRDSRHTRLAGADGLMALGSRSRMGGRAVTFLLLCVIGIGLVLSQYHGIVLSSLGAVSPRASATTTDVERQSHAGSGVGDSEARRRPGGASIIAAKAEVPVEEDVSAVETAPDTAEAHAGSNGSGGAAMHLYETKRSRASDFVDDELKAHMQDMVQETHAELARAGSSEGSDAEDNSDHAVKQYMDKMLEVHMKDMAKHGLADDLETHVAHVADAHAAGDDETETSADAEDAAASDEDIGADVHTGDAVAAAASDDDADGDDDVDAGEADDEGHFAQHAEHDEHDEHSTAAANVKDRDMWKIVQQYSDVEHALSTPHLLVSPAESRGDDGNRLSVIDVKNTMEVTESKTNHNHAPSVSVETGVAMDNIKGKHVKAIVDNTNEVSISRFPAAGLEDSDRGDGGGRSAVAIMAEPEWREAEQTAPAHPQTPHNTRNTRSATAQSRPPHRMAAFALGGSDSGSPSDEETEDRIAEIVHTALRDDTHDLGRGFGVAHASSHEESHEESHASSHEESHEESDAEADDDAIATGAAMKEADTETSKETPGTSGDSEVPTRQQMHSDADADNIDGLDTEAAGSDGDTLADTEADADDTDADSRDRSGASDTAEAADTDTADISSLLALAKRLNDAHAEDGNSADASLENLRDNLRAVLMAAPGDEEADDDGHDDEHDDRHNSGE